MKTVIGDFEIDIKVKGRSNKEKYNQFDTESFLNELSIVYDAAANFLRGNGCAPLANEYHEKSDALYELLKAAGVYDKYNT